MNLRLVFILPVVACSLFARAQDLEKKITFTGVASTTKPMLAKLSQQAGVTLSSAQLLDSDVFVLHVVDVPLKDVMSRIADAAMAEWKVEEGGYRLVPSGAKEQQVRVRETAERAAQIKKNLEKISARKQDTFSVNYADDLAERMSKVQSDYLETMESRQQYHALASATPAGRLYIRLVGLLDPNDLAQMFTGDRVVFSTSPTRMQRAFRRSATPLTRQFIAEQNIWAAAAKRMLETPEGRDAVAMPLREAALGDGNPKAILVITRQAGAWGYQLRFRVFDSEGGVLTETRSILDEEAMMRRPPEIVPEPDEPEIVLSPLAQLQKQWYKVLEQTRRRDQILPKELGEFYIDPVRNDPLSLSTSEALLGLAKAKKQNLIAVLPDSTVDSMRSVLYAPKLTASVVEGTVGRATDLRLVSEGGWLMVTPSYTFDAKRMRTDRVALSKLLQAAVSKRTMHVDDLAAHSLAHPLNDNVGHFAMEPLSALVPEAFDSPSNPDIHALRLYGSLSIPQRQALAGGGRITFQGLTPQQRQVLERKIYGSGEPYFGVRLEGAEAGGLWKKARGQFSEPTELLPNGLPNDGYFTMKTQVHDIVMAYAGPGTGLAGARSAEDLARDLFLREHPERAAMSLMDTGSWTDYRFGQRAFHQITLELSPISYLEMGVFEERVDRLKAKVKFEQLPEAFRLRVEKKIAELRKGTDQRPSSTTRTR